MRAAVAVRLIAALALCALAAPPAAAQGEEPRFVDGFEDLPLAGGLEPIAGAGVVFDTPQGRIVERYATGALDAAAIAAFYRRTLPALGWQARGALSYSREGERLTITLYPPDSSGRITVRFSLAPG